MREATAIAMRAAELGVDLSHLEVAVTSRSDHRGLLGVGDVAAAPVAVDVRYSMAAKGIEPARLREIVEWVENHSPVLDAVRRAIPVTTSLDLT